MPGGHYAENISLKPKGQRPSLHSNKYLHQTDRTLHIRVRGRLANGTLVPVHYAMIYDRHDRHIVTTDYEGHATAQVREVMGETVTLKAEGSHWRTATSAYVNFVLNGGNEGESEEHNVDIRVWGLKNGKRTAVHYASIYDAEGRHLVTTDYYGRATARVKTPLGETYTIKAEANHWQTATTQVRSGSSGGLGATYAHDNAEFVLQPEAGGKHFIVEVLDHATDKPIAGATVTLHKPDHFPGTPAGHDTTDAQGNATFDASEIDNAFLNGEARVGANHSGYSAEVQTVASGSDHYVIYLKEKKTSAVGGWAGTWSGGGLAVLQISASGGSLSYTYRGNDSNAYRLNLVGQGRCSVSGKTASCTWSQQSHDSEFAMNETGREEWTLYEGGSIQSHWVLDSTTCTPPCPGRAQYNGQRADLTYRKK